MHENALVLCDTLLKEAVLHHQKRHGATWPTWSVLDVGSRDVGNGTFRELVTKRSWNYLGVDLETGTNVDALHDIERVEGGAVVQHGPIAVRRFDVVLCGQVLEHLRYPQDAADNLSSLCASYLVVIAPAAWPEHRYPIDCWRFLPDGMRHLFGDVEPLVCGLSGTAPMIDCFFLGYMNRGGIAA
jgi:hypothetical protein